MVKRGTFQIIKERVGLLKLHTTQDTLFWWAAVRESRQARHGRYSVAVVRELLMIRHDTFLMRLFVQSSLGFCNGVVLSLDPWI